VPRARFCGESPLMTQSFWAPLSFPVGQSRCCAIAPRRSRRPRSFLFVLCSATVRAITTKKTCLWRRLCGDRRRSSGAHTAIGVNAVGDRSATVACLRSGEGRGEGCPASWAFFPGKNHGNNASGRPRSVSGESGRDRSAKVCTTCWSQGRKRKNKSMCTCFFFFEFIGR
jgi:hypothetical protein